jgi:hypothetical protein
MRRHNLRLLVLVVLAALGTACSAPRQEPAPPTAAQEATPSNLSDSGQALLALLPADGAVTGWTRKEAPRLYGADSLWDFIDGGAEAYLACGFQEVVTSEYVNPAMPSGILVDVYRMSDAAGALGIYSQERSQTGESRPIGAEGYLAGTALNFWTNAYYVKLTAFEERDDIKAAMAQLAEAVSRQIGSPGPKPSSSDWKRCGAGGTSR